jgi:hypothetical protein
MQTGAWDAVKEAGESIGPLGSKLRLNKKSCGAEKVAGPWFEDRFYSALL